MHGTLSTPTNNFRPKPRARRNCAIKSTSTTVVRTPRVATSWPCALTSILGPRPNERVFASRRRRLSDWRRVGGWQRNDKRLLRCARPCAICAPCAVQAADCNRVLATARRMRQACAKYTQWVRRCQWTRRLAALGDKPLSRRRWTLLRDHLRK
jgi:hypothetical protein